MNKFIVSAILSGIVWDVIKGSSLMFYRLFIRCVGLSDSDLRDLVAVAESIPQSNKNNKAEIRKYLKSDDNYQIVVEKVAKNISQFYMRIMKLMVMFLVIEVGILGIKKYVDVGLAPCTFENRYVTAVYTGLHKAEYTPTDEGGDTYFYTNKWDLHNRKYIRIVKLPVITVLDDMLVDDSDYDFDFVIENCLSQEIGTCLEYAKAELKISKNSSFSNEYIKHEMVGENRGLLFVDGLNKTEYLPDAVNTVLIQYTDSDYKYFIVGKCLYVDSGGYMMALLSYSGLSYDDFMNSTDDANVRLKNCFNSVRQIAYEERVIVRDLSQ